VLIVAMLALSAITSINRTISVELSLLSGAAMLALCVLHDAMFLTAERLARTLVIVALIVAVLGLAGGAVRYSNWVQLASAVEGGIRIRHLLAPTMPRSGGLFTQRPCHGPQSRLAVCPYVGAETA
jgi:hypothetical protein